LSQINRDYRREPLALATQTGREEGVGFGGAPFSLAP